MFDQKKCATCRYSAKLTETELCCVYILVEYKRRGCYGDGECDKYEKRTRQRAPKICKGGGIVYED